MPSKSTRQDPHFSAKEFEATCDELSLHEKTGFKLAQSAALAVKEFSLRESKAIQEPFAMEGSRPVRRWVAECKATQPVAVFGQLEFDRQIAFVTRREPPAVSQTAPLWKPVDVLKRPAESFFANSSPGCDEMMFVFVPAAQQKEAMSALTRLRGAWIEGRDRKMGYWPRLSFRDCGEGLGMTFTNALEGERVNRTTVFAAAKTPLGIAIALADSGLWPQSPVSPLFLGCTSIPVDGPEATRAKSALADPRWGERAVAVHASLRGAAPPATEKDFWVFFHDAAAAEDKSAVSFIRSQFEARDLAKTLGMGLRKMPGKSRQPPIKADRPETTAAAERRAPTPKSTPKKRTVRRM